MPLRKTGRVAHEGNWTSSEHHDSTVHKGSRRQIAFLGRHSSELCLCSLSLQNSLTKGTTWSLLLTGETEAQSGEEWHPSCSGSRAMFFHAMQLLSWWSSSIGTSRGGSVTLWLALPAFAAADWLCVLSLKIFIHSPNMYTFFLIGGYLFYNIVLVSAIQGESSISIPICVLCMQCRWQ